MPFLYIPHPFLYHVSVLQVPATTEITGLVRVAETREVRQRTHLQYKKLGVSVRDVNLGESETI